MPGILAERTAPGIAPLSPGYERSIGRTTQLGFLA